MDIYLCLVCSSGKKTLSTIKSMCECLFETGYSARKWGFSYLRFREKKLQLQGAKSPDPHRGVDLDPTGGCRRPLDPTGGCRRSLDPTGGCRRPLDPTGGCRRPLDPTGGCRRPPDPHFQTFGLSFIPISENGFRYERKLAHVRSYYPDLFNTLFLLLY